MSEALAVGEDLARTYGHGEGSLVAVAEASFEIQPGDLIGLMGPSGSGKTTLLHLIAGLDVPSAGTISWPALGERDQLRPGPVSMAFQGPSLLPPLTVLENAELPLLLGGRDPDASRTEALGLLERFAVDDVAEKLPEELSGGQMQRVGLARALAGGPKLILADEPTGQLDHETAGAVIEALLADVRARGAALVIATHDPLVATRLRLRWTMQDGNLRTEDELCSV